MLLLMFHWSELNQTATPIWKKWGKDGHLEDGVNGYWGRSSRLCPRGQLLHLVCSPFSTVPSWVPSRYMGCKLAPLPSWMWPYMSCLSWGSLTRAGWVEGEDVCCLSCSGCTARWGLLCVDVCCLSSCSGLSGLLPTSLFS
jgi:hypothetical protein